MQSKQWRYLRSPTAECICERCGRDYPIWHADNDAWNLAVNRTKEYSDEWAFLCPTCFVRLHEIATGRVQVWSLRAGTAYDPPLPLADLEELIRSAKEPFIVPDVTPSGWSPTTVFHILRDLVDGGALVHGDDGYRRNG